MQKVASLPMPGVAFTFVLAGALALSMVPAHSQPRPLPTCAVEWGSAGPGEWFHGAQCLARNDQCTCSVLACASPPFFRQAVCLVRGIGGLTRQH